MDSRLDTARDAVDSARTITDETEVRNQLASIRDGLKTVADEPTDDERTGDRLEEIERQLVELGNDVDELTASHLQTARDQIDAYRREAAPEWEADRD